jgi:hypothetical protein
MFSFGKVRKLTSICVFLDNHRSRFHTDISSLNAGHQTVPSSVVVHLPVGQVQDFLHRNSMPLLGKKLFAMRLCFDPDSSERARHQMNE